MKRGVGDLCVVMALAGLLSACTTQGVLDASGITQSSQNALAKQSDVPSEARCRQLSQPTIGEGMAQAAIHALTLGITGVGDAVERNKCASVEMNKALQRAQELQNATAQEKK